MSVESRVFEAHYEYKLDPKFRVSVPVAFRPAEGEAVRLQLSKEHGSIEVIKIYAPEVFADKFRLIRESDLPPAKKNTLEGSLRMMSKEVVVNPQGKLTLPKEWAERVGLRAEGSVVLAGRGNYYFASSREAFDRVSEADLEIDDGGLGVT